MTAPKENLIDQGAHIESPKQALLLERPRQPLLLTDRSAFEARRGWGSDQFIADLQIDASPTLSPIS